MIRGVERVKIGPTKEFRLRVRVATLMRILFENLGDGKLMPTKLQTSSVWIAVQTALQTAVIGLNQVAEMKTTLSENGFIEFKYFENIIETQ